MNRCSCGIWVRWIYKVDYKKILKSELSRNDVNEPDAYGYEDV
jgi:hypothetical protein